MTSAPTLVVYGNTHYDVIAEYDHMPRANDRMVPKAITLAPGGMGGNVAAAFSRLGGNSRFIGPFSNDEDGAAGRADLERDGVDISWAGTGHAATRGLILVDGNGERAIVGYYRPGMGDLPRSTGQSLDGVIEMARRSYPSNPIQLPPDAFTGPVSGSYCPFNFAPDLLPQVPDSLPVIVDMEAVHLTGLDTSTVLGVIERASVLFANQRSLARLTEFLDVREPAGIVDRTRTTIVETLGAEGCRIHAIEGAIKVPGYPVQARDTTGAGDCFAAAFSLRYLAGDDLLQAGTFACRAAAHSVQALGSRPGIPDRTFTDAFITYSQGAHGRKVAVS